jgi:hypothetical protein
MVMASAIHVGTEEGLYSFGDDERRELAGHRVNALSFDGERVWALVGGYQIFNRGLSPIWRMVIRLPKPTRLPRHSGPEITPATALHVGKEGMFVGSAGAHMVRIDGSYVERIASFDEVVGRDTWGTPWGDPPAVRSISSDGRGTTYVNVHVGGIPKTSDGGQTWLPTIDVQADVHQVLALPDSDKVFAASARGLEISEDRGMTWTTHTKGLGDTTYCRAVALCGDQLLLSASSGPDGKHAGLFTAALDGGNINRCTRGLPEEFSDNLDTHCVTATDHTAAIGTADGRVYASDDAGYSWHEEATDLPPIRCILAT